jgi:two-component sensor histidine kinase
VDAVAAELWPFDCAPALAPGSDPLGAVLAAGGLAVGLDAGMRDTVNDRIRAAVAGGAARLQAGFPACIGGSACWLDLHARIGPATGAVGPARLHGVVIDGTAQRLAAERSEAVQRELTHRIKNIIAVVGGLIALAARNAPEARPFAATMRERLVALACLYRHLEPDSDDAPGARSLTLGDFLAEIIAPYAEGVRLEIAPDAAALRIGRRAATGLALVIHELATNATKHGALSAATGGVALAVAQADGRVALHWRERGGPSLHGEPGPASFGTTMSDRIAATLLGARLSRDWQRAGLAVSLSVGIDMLAA